MKKEILLNGAAGVLALAMLGCSGSPNVNTTNANTAGMTNSGNVAVVTNSNTAVNGDTTVSSDDREFFTEAAQGGIAEVKMAQLVVGKTQNQEVKAFAQRMIVDHTKANDELKMLAAKKGVTLPADVSDDQREDYDDLAKLSGAEFDKEYVSLMVEDHEKDVSAFDEQSKDGDDAELKALAAKTLPTLKSHYEAIKTIQSKVK